jgi:hypothetical protein
MHNIKDHFGPLGINKEIGIDDAGLLDFHGYFLPHPLFDCTILYRPGGRKIGHLSDVESV